MLLKSKFKCILLIPTYHKNFLNLLSSRRPSPFKQRGVFLVHVSEHARINFNLCVRTLFSAHAFVLRPVVEQEGVVTHVACVCVCV